MPLSTSSKILVAFSFLIALAALPSYSLAKSEIQSDSVNTSAEQQPVAQDGETNAPIDTPVESAEDAALKMLAEPPESSPNTKETLENNAETADAQGLGNDAQGSPTELEESKTASTAEEGEEDFIDIDDIDLEDFKLEEEDPEIARREHRLVGWVSGGVAVAALTTGIIMGVIAKRDYDCLADIQACNAARDEPITGEDFLIQRGKVEERAVIADVAFLFAGASALVSGVSLARGYWPKEDNGDVIDNVMSTPVLAPEGRETQSGLNASDESNSAAATASAKADSEISPRETSGV